MPLNDSDPRVVIPVGIPTDQPVGTCGFPGLVPSLIIIQSEGKACYGVIMTYAVANGVRLAIRGDRIE